MGAPVGNKNAAKSRDWERAIRRALFNNEGSLQRIAQNLVKAAESGEQWAVTELGNRLDGKPSQALDVTQTILDASKLPDDHLAAIATGSGSGASEASGDSSESDGVVH